MSRELDTFSERPQCVMIQVSGETDNVVKKENNFFWLLGGLLITLLIAPIAADSFGQWLALAYSATLLVGVWSLRGSRHVFRVGWLLVAVMLVTSIWDVTYPGRDIKLANQLVFLLFGVLAMSFVVRAVLWHPRVSPNRIAGAICVYFLLGLNFALVYSMVFTSNNSAFNGIDPASSAHQVLVDLIYYSFVTLTTLGYGDITPASNMAQAFAYLEAATGVLYLAVMIAALVGSYAGAAAKDES
jgi:voltage-gated potassium channel